MLQRDSLSAERTILRGENRFNVYSWMDQLILSMAQIRTLLEQSPLREILLLEEIPG
jgi:hypothetical protein